MSFLHPDLVAAVNEQRERLTGQMDPGADMTVQNQLGRAPERLATGAYVLHSGLQK